MSRVAAGVIVAFIVITGASGAAPANNPGAQQPAKAPVAPQEDA